MTARGALEEYLQVVLLDDDGIKSRCSRYNREVLKMESAAVTIVFSVNDAYAKYLSVSIQSVICCSDRRYIYEIIVLYMDLSEENIKMLQQMGMDNVHVACKNVSESWERVSASCVTHDDMGGDVPCAHVSKETYFHILVPALLHRCDFVIYSDCDVLFLRDPAMLMKEARERKSTAVIHGVKDFSSIGMKKYVENKRNLLVGQYINAGILVMNIQRAIEEKFADICASLLPHSSEYVFVDQDMINVALSMVSNGLALIDSRWNFQWHPIGKSLLNLCGDVKDDYLKAYENPYIIHYTTADKPWKKPYKPFADLFWNIAKNSPYYYFGC